MPYNTRRKSLSLPSLGIHIPVTHAARAAAHRASQQHGSSSATPQSPSPPRSQSRSQLHASVVSPDVHPSKRVKRSHAVGSQTHAALVAKLDQTPPPSPGAERESIESDDAARTVDLEGINDEIVEAVILQLQNTGNRPHLVKELAVILMQQLNIVQQSANPCAIISSRLSSYLKRPCWTALTPCPFAKELETVHPRRTYFYLTTRPHQPLPILSAPLLPQRAIISPSASTASSSEDADLDRRRELSPSPEVDLSSPEFDDIDDDINMPGTPIGSLSCRLPRVNLMPSRGQRGTSPPLETDEREFTQTADGLQKRKLSDALLRTESLDHNMDVEYGPRDDSLFDEPKALAPNVMASMMFVTSPFIKPSVALSMKKEGEGAEGWARLESMLEWERSPENIELDELDCLLTDY